MESTLSKQKEVSQNRTEVISYKTTNVNRADPCLQLETRIRHLSREQANIKEQNQQLRSLNIQLHEQMESSKEQLQAAMNQLSVLQASAAQEDVHKQR